MSTTEIFQFNEGGLDKGGTRQRGGLDKGGDWTKGFTVLSVADSFTSPVRYQTSPQSYLNLIENNYYELNPDLPWSTDISITISYSLSGYNKGSVPSWVSIDSISGLLKISTPVIYSNHEDYAFYINSFISGQTDSVLKIIKLQGLS